MINLRVPIGLGTVYYGDRLDEQASHRQLSRFCDLGGQLLDTARCYGGWAPHGYQGMVEGVIGRWLCQDSNRDKVFLCTKGAHPLPESMSVMRLEPVDILSDLEKSLRHLRTDHIDLYLLHRDDASKPIEPMLYALECAVAQGKILRYGCSNWTLPRIREAQQMAKDKGWQGFSVNQVMWSLAQPNPDGGFDPTLVMMDPEMLAWHRESKLPVMAYTSLAHGYLIRRVHGQNVSDVLHRQYDSSYNDRVIDRLQREGVDPLTASLRYISRQDFPSVPLAAFSSEEQLKEAMQAASDSIHDDLIRSL